MGRNDGKEQGRSFVGRLFWNGGFSWTWVRDARAP